MQGIILNLFQDQHRTKQILKQVRDDLLQKKKITSQLFL